FAIACRVGKGAQQKRVHARLRRAMRAVPTTTRRPVRMVGTALRRIVAKSGPWSRAFAHPTVRAEATKQAGRHEVLMPRPACASRETHDANSSRIDVIYGVTCGVTMILAFMCGCSPQK